MSNMDSFDRMGYGATDARYDPATAPGFFDPILDVTLPVGTKEYQNWYNYYSGDSTFQAMQRQYGERGLKFMWWMNTTPNLTEDRVIAERIRLDIKPIAPRTPGSGGPTKAQQYAAAEAAIRNQAATLGYTAITEPDIKSLARTVVDQNWSGDQLTDRLVNDATKNWGALGGGTLKSAVDVIKAGAADQLISISDATAQQWARRLASDEMDMDGLRNLLQAQATARYGWAADVIASGVSMADFLAPSRDQIARELEMNAEEVSLLDPKILDMVTVTDEKNQRRVASDTELIRNARKDERWKSTGNARNMMSQAAMMIRRYVEGS
jgi:hypothetical protein